MSAKARRRGAGSVPALPEDTLIAVFRRLEVSDVVRCGAVCRGWREVVRCSGIIAELLRRRSPGIQNALSEESIRRHMLELAMDEHRRSFLNKSGDVHQWIGHSNRAYMCRMKRGLILTAGGQRMLRLWTAKRCELAQQYSIPDGSPLIDCDFDENKIIGLSSSQLVVWKRDEEKCLFQSRPGLFTQGLSMSYMDPEVVIGCEDGRARVFDIYSRNCSSIIKLQFGPVSCLTTIEDGTIVGGSADGSLKIAYMASGEVVASLKSSFSHAGMKCLSYNQRSSLLFAGSTPGYVHCWDLRVLKPLWEKRVSPNVIYGIHHLPNDKSVLAVGGLDGILRILDQNDGSSLSSLVVDDQSSPVTASGSKGVTIQKRKIKAIPNDVTVDSIAKTVRPSITSLAIGMKKIVTTHNENFVRLWRFP